MKTQVDITPDKTLIKKLGLTGYRTEQAIAELIDNAIDAKLDGMTESVDVHLDFDRRQIRVSDDGRGMNLGELKDALTIAKDPKEAEGRLGRFGLGMKSACSNLGKAFSIWTSRAGEDMLAAEYDEEKWLGSDDMKWGNFEIGIEGAMKGWRGTQITISKLNVPLYPNQMINFRRRFGLRYAPYIKNKQVEITVNSRPCRPRDPDLEEGTRRDISILLPSGNTITGWIALLRKRSIKGDYGLHIYNRNRLVAIYSKFGMRQHPTTARFIGEIALDHVPINFHKTGFLEDTSEYKEASEYFRKDPTVVSLVQSMSSSDRASDDEVQRVLGFNRYTVQAKPLSMKVSASRGKRMLRGMDGKVIEAGNVEIHIRHDAEKPDTLYEVEPNSEKTKVVINASSRVFEAFRNPLLLLGMIKAEAEALKPLNLPEAAMSERNRLWNEFMNAFLPAEKDSAARQTGPRRGLIPLPYYTLQPELVDLHDCLKEIFPHRFQFTGLSTLAPFLHNMHRTLTYNIQTETGTGQELLEAITRHGKSGRPLLNPDSELLTTCLDRNEDGFLIVIREYAERATHTWASPEKAWLDLYIEVENSAAPYAGEMVYILDDLLERDLLEPPKLRTLARRRGPRMLDKVNTFLPG